MSAQDVIVLGAGGHAKVCIELLRDCGYDVIACVSGPTAATACLGVPVLVGDDRLPDLRAGGTAHAFVALGDNALRERVAADVLAAGFELVNAVSPAAVVSPSASIGQGVAIMAGAVVNADTRIADLAIINTGATIDHDCVIGRAAHIAPQCGLAGNVTVGPESFLGIGTRVVPDIEIGAGVTIGAGATVTTDIADGITAVGTPARPHSPEKSSV